MGHPPEPTHRDVAASAVIRSTRAVPPYQLARSTSWRIFLPLAGVVVILSVLFASSYALWSSPKRPESLILLQLVLTATGFFLLLYAIHRVQRDLLSPLTQLRNWARRIRGDNLEARVPASGMGDFPDLGHDINKFSDTLQKLSENLDAEVERQTERIAQKTASLQVLYDVAASINASRDLKDLLTRFLHTMRDIVNARAGTVRLMTESGQMELVASIGLDDDVLEQERMVPVQRCLCGNAVIEGEVQFQQDLRPCNQLVGRPMLGNCDGLEMIAVPLQYRGKNLGVYNLFVDRADLQSRDDVRALFTSIGRHLGMAIEKAHLDNEAKRLSIMQERNTIAHELHDSLAQTLASLRFQVSMLDETLDQQTKEVTHQEIQQIKGGLDEAYTELRELLAHFRAPMNARGLLPALEDLISSLRKQTGMHVFLQNEWESTRLPAHLEMQVLRIIQEALANARKHSKAHTVRVLLRCNSEGNYRVLVEDDGVGMSKPAFSGHPGEHIGLSIMKERARYLGGELKIESDPGEGTRVLLAFSHSHNGDGQDGNFEFI